MALRHIFPHSVRRAITLTCLNSKGTLQIVTRSCSPRSVSGISWRASVSRLSTQQHAQIDDRRSEDSRWHIYGAVCLERTPIITRDLSPLEQEFQQMLQQIEDENSHMSNHELRHLEDLRLAEQRKAEEHEETEADIMRVTAREDEDTWAAEYEKFTPTPRTTEADRSHNTESHRRKLDSKLILLVKQQLGDKGEWVLPQGRQQEGENMRQTAERVLTDTCGSQMEASFLGNAPCGFYKYNYPASVQEESAATGAKVFFYKAHLKSGDVTDATDIQDHHWFTPQELRQYLKPKYLKQVKKFILDL